MADEWVNTTLGKLFDDGIASIQTGPFGSQLHSYDYVEQGVRVVSTEAIGFRRLKVEMMPQINSAMADQLKRHRLHSGDILFARRGAQATGLSALVESEHEGFICSTGALRLRIHRLDHIDPLFLSFLLVDESSRQWLRAHAVGAVMPNLNEEVIRGLPILLPPTQEQRAIAQMLRVLDDKIELNRRMNHALEALARALFKSWFVDFDPVVAKAAGKKPVGMSAQTAALFPDRFQDSVLGPIPKGWRPAPLSDAIEVNPPRLLAPGIPAPYLDMQNMPTSGHRPLAWWDRAAGSGMRFQNGDVLVARITPCLENGKTAFVDFLNPHQIAWGSTEYIVLRSKPPLPLEFAYYLARSDDFRGHAIANMTGSSGRQRVPANCLNGYMIVVPEDAAVTAFGRLAGSTMNRVRRNDEQNQTLTMLRDVLLPQLMSGEMRVRQAENLVAQVI